MAEQPLLTCQARKAVPTAFSELSRRDQGLFLSLHCGQCNANDMKMNVALREKPTEGLHTWESLVELQAKGIAIHRTNCIAAREETVVCGDISRLNHSCLTNAHHRWNENIGAVIVHPVKNIAIGEQILVSCIPLCRDRVTRTARLGFECNCAACDTTTAFGEASEMRRTMLSLIEGNLAMQRHLTDVGVHNDHKQGISTVIQSMKLLGEEGICGWEWTRRFFCAKLQIRRIR